MGKHQKDYASVTPVQQFDNMACWAASMEWWLKYMSPKRNVVDQINILTINGVAQNTDPNTGGLNQAGMKALFNHGPFRMRHKRYAGGSMDTTKINGRLMRKGPIVIIYNEPAVNGYHANVIVPPRDYANTTSLLYLTTMDPNTATFENRPFQHYMRNEYFMAWAK